MKSEFFIPALFSLFAVLPLRAAEKTLPAAEEQTRYVRTLFITEYWVPGYVKNKLGLLEPAAPGPFESPPDNFVVRTGGRFERLAVPANTLGPDLPVKGATFDLGTLTKAAPDKKQKEEFAPVFSASLKARRSLLCLYPKARNDWRNIGEMFIELDAINPGDGRALVLNVSAAVIHVRAASGQPAAIAPGRWVAIPCPVSEEKIRVQAYASLSGRQELVANSMFDVIPDSVPVLVFLNADPKLGSGGVTMLRENLTALPSAPATAVAK